MFWRKRKPQEIPPLQTLVQLASRLGVERRVNVRIRYPACILSKLPEVFFADTKLKIVDISVGGCCLLDPSEVLGPQVGNEIQMNIHWPTGLERVNARIVSRVEHRRHIQFLNLSRSRQNFLTKAMTPGVRAQRVHRHNLPINDAVEIEALEMWSSALGDSVTIENGVHRIAQVQLQNEVFHIFRDAWPQKLPSGKCSKADFEQIILFLCNIPLPSRALEKLRATIEQVWSQG